MIFAAAAVWLVRALALRIRIVDDELALAFTAQALSVAMMWPSLKVGQAYRDLMLQGRRMFHVVIRLRRREQRG